MCCDLKVLMPRTQDSCRTFTMFPNLLLLLFCFISYSGEISVKIGEELKLDVLLSNADKVEHQPKSSTEWTEVWKRGSGVHSTLMSNTDGNLIIKEFTPSDAGTYRVLDLERNILITVTVTESGTESKGKLNYTDADKPNVVWFWTLAVVLHACVCFWILWFWNCFRFLSSRSVCL